MPEIPLKRYAQGDQMHIRVRVGGPVAKAEATTARILMRTHLWLLWAEIAIDQEALARQARARALALTPTGEGFGLELSAETRASLVAVTACSFALDALYGVVTEYVPASRARKRPFRILETLKRGFNVGRAGGGPGPQGSGGSTTSVIRPNISPRRTSRQSPTPPGPTPRKRMSSIRSSRPSEPSTC
jgi:hypothetical protein